MVLFSVGGSKSNRGLVHQSEVISVQHAQQVLEIHWLTLTATVKGMAIVSHSLFFSFLQ